MQLVARVGTVLCALLGAHRAKAQGQAFFAGLGDLPGGEYRSIAYDISPEGSCVVGFSAGTNGSWQAFRWTRAEGMVALGSYPDSPVSQSIAFAVSRNGEAIVGRYMPLGGQFPYYSMKWTPTEGMGPLYGPETDAHSTEDIDASGVTSALVYFCTDGSCPIQNLVWVDSSNYTVLPMGPGEVFRSGIMTAISDDGRAVVGTGVNAAGRTHAFRWMAETGMVDIPSLPGGVDVSEGTGVSADGAAVIGWSRFSDGIEAFRWRADTGIISLGDLGPSVRNSIATGISADGSIVVGRSAGPFIWDEQHGIRSLHLLAVQEYGLNLDGWALSDPEAISADGRTIAGWGLNPQRQEEAWVLSLGPACAPDWDASGVVNSSDFFAFIQDFLEGRADFDHSGTTTSSDFFAYLVAFFEGCT